MQRYPHPLLDTVAMIFGVRTDRHLARRLNTSTSTVSRIRKGTQPVSSDMILKIHAHAGLTLENITDFLKEKRLAATKEPPFLEKAAK